jgi:hypothetical protein
LPARGVLLPALRRLLVLVLGGAAAIAAVSLPIGLLAGASASRSLALGYYLVGSFCLIAGFFVGNRGPVRPKSDLFIPMFGPRFMRWATPEERDETINMSAVYVVLGLVLIVFGVLADTRYSLF